MLGLEDTREWPQLEFRCVMKLYECGRKLRIWSWYSSWIPAG